MVCKASRRRVTVALAMGSAFLILILVGAALALVTAAVALRAYLRLRRVRAALSGRLTGEVADLARRTGELEMGLSDLAGRIADLLRVPPVPKNDPRLG